MGNSVEPAFNPIRPDGPGEAPSTAVETRPAKPARARRRRGNLALAVLAVILAGSGLGFGLYTLFPPASTEPVTLDMAGNRVQADPGAVLAPSAEPAASHNPDIGLRFIVPSVQLDVPLGTSNMVDNVIAPPGFQSAYLIGNLGVGLDKADQGTVYVAAHSLRNGGVAPGNYLIDVEAEKPKVNPGDLIEVSNLTYTVTETRIIPKPDVSDVSDLWTAEPKRLVVFTCMLNADNSPSRDNLVVIATLNP